MSKKTGEATAKRAPQKASRSGGVEFVARIPEAREVRITGDFSLWSKEGQILSRRADGNWAVLLPLHPGEYQYRLIVDGEWRDDPAAEKTAPNPYGGTNAVLIVR